MATFVRVGQGFANSTVKCTELESVHLVSCPLVTANIQWAFSFTTLRQLSLGKVTIPDESIHAFCRAISFSSLEYVSMDRVSFPPDHEFDIATTIARCNTLEQFHFLFASSIGFCHCYYEALSNNFDTKLERLFLSSGTESMLDLVGDHGTARGMDAATEAKIRSARLVLPYFPPLAMPKRMSSACIA